MIEVVVLDRVDEAGIDRDRAAVDRHPAGHGQQAARQAHRRHQLMALGEAQRMPRLHDRAGRDDAVLVGGDAVDVGHQMQERQAAGEGPGRQQRVAVEHDHGGVRGRARAADRAQRAGQAVALAGAGAADEHQADLGRRLHLLEQPLDQALVAELDDRRRRSWPAGRSGSPPRSPPGRPARWSRLGCDSS